jgi:hypothetical protein
MYFATGPPRVKHDAGASEQRDKASSSILLRGRPMNDSMKTFCCGLLVAV